MNFEWVHRDKIFGNFIVSGKQISCNYSPARNSLGHLNL